MNLFKQLNSIDDSQLRINKYEGVLARKFPGYEEHALCSPKDISIALSEVLKRRRSAEGKSPYTINEKVLSSVLYWSCGKLSSDTRDPHSTYPTFGAMSSLSVYVVIDSHIDGYAPGVYCYGADQHCLILIEHVSLSKLKSALLEQPTFTNFPSVFVMIIGDVNKGIKKYGMFAHQLLLLEAGHVLQNLALCSTAMSYNTRLYSYRYATQVEIELDLRDGEMFLEGLSIC